MATKTQLITLRIPSELLPAITQFGSERQMVKPNGRVNLNEAIVALLKQSLLPSDAPAKTENSSEAVITTLQTRVDALVDELANTVKLADFLAFKDSILGELAA